MLSSGNAMVDSMAEINITGNIIPQIWYKKILRDNGKPHLLAITILADIVYWYRPTEVRDETTSALIGFRKKFAEDLLQKSYDAYADLYGESKKSVKCAMDTLEDLGIIKRYLRDIIVKNGIKVPNVMYIELCTDRLRDITFEESKDDNSTMSIGPDKFVGRGVRNCNEDIAEIDTSANEDVVPLYTNLDTPPVVNEDTNTYNTFENNTDNNSKTHSENTEESTTEIINHSFTSFSHSGNAQSELNDGAMEEDEFDQELFDSLKETLENNIGLKSLLYNHPANKKLINRMVLIMVNAMTAEEGYVYVSKKNRSLAELRERYLSLENKHIEHVLQRLPEDDDSINLRDKYLLACLFNAPETIEQICKTSQIHQKKSNNPFMNYTHREYDYEDLEKQLLCN